MTKPIVGRNWKAGVDDFLATWEVTIDESLSLRENILSNMRDLMAHIAEYAEVGLRPTEGKDQTVMPAPEDLIHVDIWPLGFNDAENARIGIDEGMALDWEA